jgi:MEMO1 family protein
MIMRIRKPAVAGRFYPADATVLRTTIERHLAAAPVEPAPTAVAAVISPHAGYPYSGLTAAHAFKRLLGKAPTRVVVLGCSHQFHFEGISLFDHGGYETPLGVVPVDEELTEYLADCFGNVCPEAHYGEHALEVQVPFLQAVLQGEFQLVPVLFGGPPNEMQRTMGTELAKCLGEDDLVIASTDLSHFLCEKDANKIDRYSLEQVLTQDEENLCDGVADERCSLCGASAVVAAMAYANAAKATQWQLLDYRTSAWASGDTSRVVGYGAISMERETA